MTKEINTITINAWELVHFQNDELKLLGLGEFPTSTIQSLAKEMEETGFVLYDPWVINPSKLNPVNTDMYNQAEHLQKSLNESDGFLKSVRELIGDNIDIYKEYVLNLKKMVLAMKIQMCKFNSPFEIPNKVLKDLTTYMELVTLNIELCSIILNDFMKNIAEDYVND